MAALPPTWSAFLRNLPKTKLERRHPPLAEYFMREMAELTRHDPAWLKKRLITSAVGR